MIAHSGLGVLNREITVRLRPYEYKDCGCGCGESGQTVFADGHCFGDVPDGDMSMVMHMVLDYLGFDLTIEYEEGLP